MLPDRKNHRLNGYDYRRYGYYYVTVCTRDRKCLLPSVDMTVPPVVGSDALIAPEDALIAPEDALIAPEDALCAERRGGVVLTELGKRVNDSWNNIALVNDNVEMGRFVIMPNHIHGIILIKNTDLPLKEDIQYNFQIAERRGLRSLQGLIRDFKSVTTRVYKRFYGGDGSLWQESFYEEIIRSKDHFYRVNKYIDENPKVWAYDELYSK